MAAKFSLFLAELKRRKVYHVAGVYVVVGLGVLGAAEVILDPLGLGGLRKYIVILVLLGFPIALVLAWAYELRPEKPRTHKLAVQPPGAEGRKSVVVLPFDNMSPDPGDAYFADGLTEELISHLSQVHSLRVISRSSAVALKAAQKDLRTIARELDIHYVLEGSVRKAGENLRITAQLIDAASDEHVWAERYDGVLEDVFGMQETVSRSIVDALRLSLSPEEDQRLAHKPIEDIQAYELYLMARRDIGLATPDGIDRARRYLETGLEIVGENVAILQGLAEVHLQAHEYGIKADEETLRAVEELADRISNLRPDSPQSHYLKGRIQRFEGHITDAIGHFERALASDPMHASSRLFLFHSYGFQVGRPDHVAPMREEVHAKDPLDVLTNAVLGFHDWMRGDLERAFDTFRSAGQLEGASDFGNVLEAYILIWMNRANEACDLLRDLARRDTPDLFTEWGRFLLESLNGNGEAAKAALGDQTKNYLWNDPEFMWLGASTFALSGETGEALDWLEHIVDRGWINYPLLSTDDPLLANIRGEDRFEALMVKVGRDWKAFGALLADS